MSRLVKWCTVLWIVVSLTQAGCSPSVVVTMESGSTLTAVPVVAVHQSEHTLAPTPMLVTPTAGSLPSLDPTGTLVVPSPLSSLVPTIIISATDPSWYHYWRPSARPVQVHDLAVGGEWLWVATPQGLMRVNQHTLVYEQFTHADGSRGVALEGLTNLLVEDDDRLWAGGMNGLMRYDDGSGWTVITTMTAHSFALDAEDNVWLLFTSRSGRVGLRFPGSEPPPNGDWEPETITEFSHWGCCEAWRFLTLWWYEYSSQAECLSLSDRCKTCDVYGNDWSVKSCVSDFPNLSTPRMSLIRCNGEVVSTMLTPRCAPSAIVAAGVKDGVWIGSDRGLFYGANGTVWEYRVVTGKLIPEPDVRAFAFTSDGHAWVSALDGLFRFDEERKVWQPITVGKTISVGEGAPIAADDRGNLWLLGDDSLARFDGRVWRSWSLPETAQGCDPRSGTIVKFRGEVWVAVGACGLWRFNGETWDKSSLGSEVATLIQGLDNKLYAVTEHEGVYAYDKVRWGKHLVDEATDGPGNNVIAVYADGSIRRAWVGGRSKTRLWRYAPEEIRDDPLQVPVDFIFASLLVDSRGDLWVGGPLGLLRCDERACQSLYFANDNAWGEPYVNALAEDPQGRIWVGGRGWLSVYDPAVERD